MCTSPRHLLRYQQIFLYECSTVSSISKLPGTFRWQRKNKTRPGHEQFSARLGIDKRLFPRTGLRRVRIGQDIHRHNPMPLQTAYRRGRARLGTQDGPKSKRLYDSTRPGAWSRRIRWNRRRGRGMSRPNSSSKLQNMDLHRYKIRTRNTYMYTDLHIIKLRTWSLE